MGYYPRIIVKVSISSRGERSFRCQAQIPCLPASFLVSLTTSHTGAGRTSCNYYEQDLEVSAAHLKERDYLQLSQVLEWCRCSWTNFRLLISLVFMRILALKDAYGIDKMSLKVWRQCKNMWVLIVSSRHILNVMMTRTTREVTFKEKEMTHELKWRYRESRVREKGPLSWRKGAG